MARCEDCLHYKVCLDTETRHLKIILAGDKAERCKQFMPAADVVPKSEWNRIYTELEGLKSSTLPRLRLDLQMANTKVAEADMAKAEVAREIFEEIEELLKRTCEKGYCGSISDLFAELKNKYAEEKE